MNLITFTCIALTFLLSIITHITASPIYYSDYIDHYISSPFDSSADRYDDDYYYANSAAQRRTQSSNLKRGYYYVDDSGSVIPVKPSVPSGQRRQDAADSSADSSSNTNDAGVVFTPLVRYKQTKTKRHKLFVPNFFG